MGARDRFQSRREVVELGLAEPPREVLADAAQVCPGGLTDDPAPPVGEAAHDDPRVLLDALSVDEVLVDELIHQPGQAARREHHAVGEFRHPQSVPGGSGQAQEDVVSAEREAMLGSELGVELPGEVVVGVQERLPGTELGLAELRLRSGGSGGRGRVHLRQCMSIYFALQRLQDEEGGGGDGAGTPVIGAIAWPLSLALRSWPRSASGSRSPALRDRFRPSCLRRLSAEG